MRPSKPEAPGAPSQTSFWPKCTEVPNCVPGAPPAKEPALERPPASGQEAPLEEPGAPQEKPSAADLEAQAADEKANAAVVIEKDRKGSRVSCKIFRWHAAS